MRPIIIAVLGLAMGCGGNSAGPTEHSDGACSSGEGGQQAIADGGFTASGGHAGNSVASGSGGAAGMDHGPVDSEGGIGNDAASGSGGAADAGHGTVDSGGVGNDAAGMGGSEDAGNSGAAGADSGSSNVCDPEARTRFLTEAPVLVCEALQTTDCVAKEWKVLDCIRRKWRPELTPAEAANNGGLFSTSDLLCGSKCEAQFPVNIQFFWYPQVYDVPHGWRESGSPTVQEIINSCTAVADADPANPVTEQGGQCEDEAKFLTQISTLACTAVQATDCATSTPDWSVLTCLIRQWRPDLTVAEVAAQLEKQSYPRGIGNDFCVPHSMGTISTCADVFVSALRDFSPEPRFIRTPPDWRTHGNPTAQQLVDSCSQ